MPIVLPFLARKQPWHGAQAFQNNLLNSLDPSEKQSIPIRNIECKALPGIKGKEERIPWCVDLAEFCDLVP